MLKQDVSLAPVDQNTDTVKQPISVTLRVCIFQRVRQHEFGYSFPQLQAALSWCT